MRADDLTYGQLERLLIELGYKQVPSQENIHLFANAEYDAISVLPNVNGEEKARPHHIITLRKIATEKGIIDDIAFMALVDQVRQTPTGSLARAS